MGEKYGYYYGFSVRNKINLHFSACDVRQQKKVPVQSTFGAIVFNNCVIQRKFHSWKTVTEII